MDSSQMSKLLVLFTGGTIGMVKNEDSGLAPVRNIFLENIRKRPNMHDENDYILLPDDAKTEGTCLLPKVEGLKTRILYTIKEYDPLLDSSNMGANEWKIIGTDIKNNYDSYDAFVVLHGTDTLAYTASALSFSLENLSKTIVITGSQLSIFETRTDGISNFTNALAVAAINLIPEVCIVFGKKLMRGNRTAKISSTDFDAFDSPNAPPLGTIQIHIEIDKSLILPLPSNKELRVYNEFNSNIVMLRLTPNIPIEMVKAGLGLPTEGVILQTFGAGNVPSNREDILNVLTDATKRGVIIVNTTQCRHGAVEAIYETGQVLDSCGVIPGFDMTEEAAYTKLANILARDLSLDEKKKKMQENICGELTLPSDPRRDSI